MDTLTKIKKALEVVKLDDVKLEVLNESNFSIDVDPELTDFEGYFIDGIYLYNDMREVSSIARTIKVPHWIVGYDMWVGGHNGEPDDVDFVVHSELRSLFDSITEVINLINKWKLDNAYEYMAYEDFFQSIL